MLTVWLDAKKHLIQQLHILGSHYLKKKKVCVCGVYKEPASHMKNVMYQVISHGGIMSIFIFSLLLFSFPVVNMDITFVIRKKNLFLKVTLMKDTSRLSLN